MAQELTKTCSTLEIQRVIISQVVDMGRWVALPQAITRVVLLKPIRDPMILGIQVEISTMGVDTSTEVLRECMAALHRPRHLTTERRTAMVTNRAPMANMATSVATSIIMVLGDMVMSNVSMTSMTAGQPDMTNKDTVSMATTPLRTSNMATILKGISSMATALTDTSNAHMVSMGTANIDFTRTRSTYVLRTLIHPTSELFTCPVDLAQLHLNRDAVSAADRAIRRFVVSVLWLLRDETVY